MPVLYEIAIFLQEEMMEQYFEQEGVTESMTIDFDTGLEAHLYL